MGFMNRISNWLNTSGAKAYNSIKSGMKTGYNVVHGVAHKIGSIADSVDNLVTQARNLPLIGVAAEALQAHPIYKEIKDSIHTGVKVVDQVGDAGSAIGNVIDTAISNKGGG
jgi:phage-related protein